MYVSVNTHGGYETDFGYGRRPQALLRLLRRGAVYEGSTDVHERRIEAHADILVALPENGTGIQQGCTRPLSPRPAVRG